MRGPDAAAPAPKAAKAESTGVRMRGLDATAAAPKPKPAKAESGGARMRGLDPALTAAPKPKPVKAETSGPRMRGLDLAATASPPAASAAAATTAPLATAGPPPGESRENRMKHWNKQKLSMLQQECKQRGLWPGALIPVARAHQQKVPG